MTSHIRGKQPAADMMLRSRFGAFLDDLRELGSFKTELSISGPQQVNITSSDGPLLNMCANNYLGLSADPRVIEAAHSALDSMGSGMSSVRFICGTHDAHRELEGEIAAFLGYEDAILYGSCFDANVGVFSALTDAGDTIISDALNHASIIDGVRLSSAKRLVYRHGDVEDLRSKLEQSDASGMRIIATDGVFSMEGDLAPLQRIAEVAADFGAVLLVDDSHGVGVVGEGGRGTVWHLGVVGATQLQTGTFGKALGGASGGYVVGPAVVIETLRQKSRPYLFSNALAPAVVGAAQGALAVLRSEPELVATLQSNAAWFRDAMSKSGFEVLPGDHPIVAVMVGDEQIALNLAQEVRNQGVMVVAFTYPVVPQSAARIRIQISAGHSLADLTRAVDALTNAGHSLGIL